MRSGEQDPAGSAARDSGNDAAVRCQPPPPYAIPAQLDAWKSVAAATRREVEDLVKTQHGDRYVQERKTRTELARIKRELKQLRAQIAALEERQAELLSELGEQG